MTAEEKVGYVRQQIEDMQRGLQKHITCPYCNLKTYAGDDFCCTLLPLAIKAIMDRQDMQRRFDEAARILDQHMSAVN